MFLGVIVAGLGHADVLIDDGLALVQKVSARRLRSFRIRRPQRKTSAPSGHGVLHDGRDGSRKGLSSCADGERNGEDVVANRNVQLELIGVEQDRAARLDFWGVALDGVLVQRDQGIEVVALGLDLFLAHAQPQPDVAAANDRLIAVESVCV